MQQEYGPTGAERQQGAHTGRGEAHTPDLAKQPDILSLFAKAIKARGLVGEEKAAKLIYLSTVSRLALADGQVSIIAKAQSSAGKSYTATQVFRFFREGKDALYTSSMSPKALAYVEDVQLAHKTLYIGEASGIASGDGASMLRQLLSEGRLCHRTVINGQGETLSIDGPLNVVVTTTENELDAELETRALTVTLDESREQTKAIMMARARRAAELGSPVEDLAPWYELQEWLATANHRVRVPFAEKLADLIPPVAVRLRRDIGAVLNLIAAHAMLHQATRPRAPDGAVLATLDDYAAVRELLVDIVSEGLDVTVKPEIRKTVETVRELGRAVQQKDLVKELGLDKSTVSRRVKQAVVKGYLVKSETLDGAPVLSVGDPMPEGQEVLPSVARLQAVAG